MNLFFEYSGFIVIILLLIGAYQVFYKKKPNNIEDNTKLEKKSKLKESKIYKYLYEIYVTRAKKRRLLCFLPWVGLWVSAFAVVWFLVSTYLSLVNPIQKFENLTEWRGTLISYRSYRKADDIATFRLEDNTTKSFHSMITEKDIKRIDKKKVIFWTQRDFGLSDGLFTGEFYYDREKYLVLEENYDEISTKKEYEKSYKRIKEIEDNTIPNLTLSLKWLLGFLFLLWFINRKDVEKEVLKDE
ncbi:hypothetical protein [Sulfurimonas sp. CS5]|uniref:hypothetical protein n=1 Tax=Sulfurimonas sp. CS5 TaxID=3391145 RepID=UPI0039E99A18